MKKNLALQLLLVLTCFTALVSVAAAAEDRPNVVFILTDDQRFDALGCLGHPLCVTPNLDRLRREGVLFKNAFVTTSLCSPARACFLTGTYAHTNGVFDNTGREFDHAKTPSYPKLLQKAGYSTAFVGKWHMGHINDPRPGFDYWLSFTGQGTYFDPQLDENGRDFSQKGYTTDILTDYAIKFLREKRDKSKPFCLYLSHKAVHGPFTPAPRHKDVLAGKSLPEPESFKDTFRGKPKWQRLKRMDIPSMNKVAPKGKRKWKNADEMAQAMIDFLNSDAEIPDELPAGGGVWKGDKPARLGYYAAIWAIDDGVGRVLAELEKMGALNNTLIFFAGDNGYFHGEHGRGDKRLMYEEALRIPLLLRYPPLVKPNSTVKQMVLNIDVAPTVLAATGTPIPATMQGQSFLPLLSGKKDVAWRKSFLYEYWADLTPKIPRMVGVRTETAKLVTYPDINDIGELYDLAKDSKEMTNLYENPEYAALRKVLEKELKKLMHKTNYQNRVLEKKEKK